MDGSSPSQGDGNNVADDDGIEDEEDGGNKSALPMEEVEFEHGRMDQPEEEEPLDEEVDVERPLVGPIKFKLTGLDFRPDNENTADLAKYKGITDKVVKLRTLKEAKFMSVAACTRKNRVVLRNTMLSLRMKYHFGPGIDLISWCPQYTDPELEGMIKVAPGQLNGGLRLTLNALAVRVLNFIENVPHQLTPHSWTMFYIMDKLNELAEFGNGSIDVHHFLYYNYFA